MQIVDKYTVSASMTAKRSGAILRELQAEDIIITRSEAAEIKTSMSCFLYRNPDINLLSDRLCPFQVVNGVRYPMGEYVIATVSDTNQMGRRGWQVDAYDLGLIVSQTASQQRLYLAQGENYIMIIQSLLIDCGVTRAIVEPCPLSLSVDREWGPGTDYLTIVNTLLKEINYGGLWFDREGVAHLEKIKPDGAGNPISYLPDEYSIIRDGTTGYTDAFTAYNVFTAVVSSPDYPPMYAIAVNDSPLSPISTVNRRRRVCAPIQYLDAISGQEELDRYVKKLVQDSMWGYETVEFGTLPIPEPWHDDTIILDSGTYRETGWEITLGSGGTYIHTARKKVLL